jgi:hypothetical protein
MDKIFIIKNSLVELKSGQLVKSAIELPNDLVHLITAYDFKIMAICHDACSILIYELIDIQFVLKHKINKTPIVLNKFWNNQVLYSFASNYLILKYLTYCSHICEIIDLENTNDDLDGFIMFHGSPMVYCDGILSFYPSKYSKQYYNLNLADKTITHEHPYFIEKNMQIILNATTNGNRLRYVKGLFIVDNDIYHILTGNLLGNIGDLTSYTGFNIDYFVLANKMKIAPSANVTEYEYEGLYIYDIDSSTGSLTKPAIADI